MEGYGETEAAAELNDGAVKVDQAVGNGHVLVVEYPTENICLTGEDTDAYLQMVQKAHEATGRRFITTEYIYTIRGDIEIYKALSNPLSIQGNFVDLLAQNQDLITEKRLQPGEVAILKRYKTPGRRYAEADTFDWVHRGRKPFRRRGIHRAHDEGPQRL